MFEELPLSEDSQDPCCDSRYGTRQGILTLKSTNQVPLDLPFSINKVLAFYHSEARRAAPEAPEPPPTIMKSYYSVIGAMVGIVLERCLDMIYQPGRSQFAQRRRLLDNAGYVEHRPRRCQLLTDHIGCNY